MNSNSKIIYLSPQRCATTSFYFYCKKLRIRSLSWKEQTQEKFDLLAVNKEYDKIINHSLFVENQSFSDTPFWDLKLAEYIENNCENVFFVYLQRPFESWFKSMVTHSMGMTFDDIRVHAYYYHREEDIEFLNSIGFDTKSLHIVDSYSFYRSWYYKNHISTLKFLSEISDKFTFTGQLNNENVWEEMFRKFNVDTSGIDFKKRHFETISEKVEAVKENNKELNLFFGSKILESRA